MDLQVGNTFTQTFNKEVVDTLFLPYLALTLDIHDRRFHALSIG